MAKYSYAFKKKVVFEYLHDHVGSTTLGKKYGITQKQIRNWIHSYETFGDDGIKRSRQKNEYTFEFKLSMVESYLSNEVSYEELALANGISNHSLISRWVKDFRIAGPDALRPHKKGKHKTVGNINDDINHKALDQTPIDTSVEHVKELEDELLKLRIENAFLKELRRLRLEDEAKMREWRSSSTVSEESSN